LSDRPARCPSPRELEHAYWSGDARVRLHAAGCLRCSPQWAEIAALVEVGRAIAPPPSSPGRREEIRSALLAGKEAAIRTPAPRIRRAWRMAGLGAAAAAAAAVAIAWWLWPREEARVAVARAHVLAHDGARYLAGAQPDEIVRLVDGTLTVEVEPLRPGERFRVVTGDAEVEVKGTAFDVAARADRLESVRVVHGLVEVRRSGGRALLLGAGQSWQAPPRTESKVPAATQDAAAADASRAATGTRDPVTDGEAGAPSRPQRRGSRIQTRVDAGPPPASRTAAQQAFDDGWRAIRAGRFGEAAEAFERAASADGSAAVAEDARYWRAVALARAGDEARAIGAFESFLDAHPAATRAGESSVMLGWLLFDRGDHAAAARRFRAAIADPSPRIRASAAQGLNALRRAGH
jgi:TolA-binding protein